MSNNLNNLHVLIEKISKNEILLPDFQRKFVWNDLENKQKKLISSVLAWLPIGSILLLDGNRKEFVAKKLGRKSSIESSDENGQFLLDGQQRLTVLSNAFSNVIYNDLTNWKDISSGSLKNRFLLKFKIKEIEEFKDSIDNHPDSLKSDVLGFYNLRFPFDPNLSEPQFLTEDILSYITIKNINENEKNNPFHPQFNFSSSGATTKLTSVCNEHVKKNEYYIPLFLLIGNNSAQLKILVKNLSKVQESLLIDLYENSDIDERNKRFNILFPMVKSSNYTNLPENFSNDENEFSQFLNRCSETWASNFNDYLSKSVNNLKVNVMEVSKSQRARAIDIYENLNQGGMSLDTFDLIIAKAAKVYHDGFYDSFIESIKQEITVPIFYEGNTDGNLKWNAFDNYDIYYENKYQVAGTYISVFLNLLSLVIHIVNNPDITHLKEQEIGIGLIKKELILRITSEDIVNNFKKVTLAINRALSYLKLNCGIRHLDDIAYEHMLLGLSYFFYFDDIFENKKKTKILDYWYWTSIFSGHYDSDQNVKIQVDLRLLSRILFKNKDSEILKTRLNDVFNKINFSDKETLLHDHIRFEILPKEVIKKSICQYVLKKTPHDFISNTKLTSWDENLSLEFHHIIPLNAQRNIKESTKALRYDKKNILNSPLNYTLILKESNNLIGGFSIDRYFKVIQPYVQSQHYLPRENKIDNNEKVREWLEERYLRIKDELTSYLKGLESNFPIE